MTLYLENHTREYELRALGMLFFFGARFTVSLTPPDSEEPGDFVHTAVRGNELYASLRVNGQCLEARGALSAPLSGNDLDMALGALVFPLLCQCTGYRPPFGMLTGVRPAKLYRELYERAGPEAAKATFLEQYLVQPDKQQLLCETALLQQQLLKPFSQNSYSLYVSIPFCPTRCRYCSFVSHSIKQAGELIEPYLQRLLEEIAFSGGMMKERGLALSTVYIGGGTPTTLSAPQLHRLLTAIHRAFPVTGSMEYTVEAGRPDTITREKLAVLREFSVNRVSVNPQSFTDPVLAAAGRPHTGADVERSFLLVKELGFPAVNMDLIAGLPGESEESFHKSLTTAIHLRPENLTVHALTHKRASDLQGALAHTLPSQMISTAYTATTAAGYSPYYLYRQKGTPGNLENTGYTLPGFSGLYNVLIMDESHHILSVGAGGVSKRIVGGGKIERSFNHKYPYEYIRRMDEVLERKKTFIEGF